MIIAAKYALLGPGIVRQDVRIEYDGPRILSIHSGPIPGALSPDLDFGLAVITPGWANAHTHLELEFCAGQVPFNGSFAVWLQQIRDLKKERANQLSAQPLSSLRQLASSGCTTIGDHHASELDWPAIAEAGLRYLPLREVFEFNNHKPDLARLESWSQYSWAPHAPYSTSLELMRACRALANARSRPLSIHLSEFAREVQFIRDGRDDEIAQLHSTAGTTNPDWRGTGKSPVRYIADAGILDGPTLAIHVNYLEPGDLDILAQLKPTVVFCPRSHQFFQHQYHPLEQFLAAGIPVALGTDSLASNERLSPLHEAGLVRQLFPAVPPATVFSSITDAALAPYGLAHELGRLDPGCLADLAVYPLAGDPGAEFEALFAAVIATGEASLAVCQGLTVHSKLAAVAG